MTGRAGCWLLAALCGLLSACGDPNRRLDEYVFHTGPRFSLKVVRYFRNIPFQPLGEYALVMCRSDTTAAHAPRGGPDAGWRPLGEVPVPAGADARTLAAGLPDDYRALDADTLIVTTTALRISFDACGQFARWDPARLPRTMVVRAPGPEACAPAGAPDCRDGEFEGARKPRYSRVRVAGPGRVSFRVTSPAFRAVQSLRVETRDQGGLWQVETVSTGSEGQRIDPAGLRALAPAGPGMAGRSLAAWFESLLPPGAMLIWPDRLGACGAGGERRSDAACAEIRFSTGADSAGTVHVEVFEDARSGRRQAAFHSAVYQAAGAALPITSAQALRSRLGAGGG